MCWGSGASACCERVAAAMSNKWIEEELEPGLRVNYRLSKLLNTKQSKWQTVDLVRPRLVTCPGAAAG